MLVNASDVTLVPKNMFFLKIMNLGQNFVECKVSLADSTTFVSKAADQDGFLEQLEDTPRVPVPI
jgi:hypothetical protein